MKTTPEQIARNGITCPCHANRIEHTDWALSQMDDPDVIDRGLDVRLELARMNNETEIKT